jgi:hypothetical protein
MKGYDRAAAAYDAQLPKEFSMTDEKIIEQAGDAAEKEFNQLGDEAIDFVIEEGGEPLKALVREALSMSVWFARMTTGAESIAATTASKDLRDLYIERAMEKAREELSQ